MEIEKGIILPGEETLTKTVIHLVTHRSECSALGSGDPLRNPRFVPPLPRSGPPGVSSGAGIDTKANAILRAASYGIL